MYLVERVVLIYTSIGDAIKMMLLDAVLVLEVEVAQDPAVDLAVDLVLAVDLAAATAVVLDQAMVIKTMH